MKERTSFDALVRTHYLHIKKTTRTYKHSQLPPIWLTYSLVSVMYPLIIY